jgi:nitrogen fixation/metabolism regulation signal transduction histidine kinase
MRRLRFQLVATLVLVALLPALPAAWTVHALVRRSLDPLLVRTIQDGLAAGRESLRSLLRRERDAFAAAIAGGGTVDTLAVEHLDRRTRQSLEALSRGRGETLANGTRLLAGPEPIRLEDGEALLAKIQGPGGRPVWVVRHLPQALRGQAERIREAAGFLEALRRRRGPVLRSLVASFLVVYGVVVVLALGIGLVLASRLTRPLEALAASIGCVAEGDLDARVPLRGGGEMRRLLAAFNDMVARLRSQQEELLRLEKLATWRDMSRRLAHEIKNPLTPIQLAAQELREAYRGDDAAFRKLLEEATGIIQEEVHALRELVRSFSELGRLPEPRMRWAGPQAILSELQSLYGPEKLTARCEEGAPERLWCDPDQIHRVLVNLVNNALEAQEATGRREPVQATVSGDAGGGVCFSVADRGPGVPREERERIFQPDVSGKPGGMGLGLTIVEGIVRAHGGSVSVEDRPGGGAVFTVRLPGGPKPEEEAVS